MSRYILKYHGKSEEQRSSGIWISTAAGSTGAVRSAGGQVLPEESPDLQFVVRELYRSKYENARFHSGIFKPDRSLQVVSLMKDGIIYVDGSHTNIPFPSGETITVKNSHCPLKVITA